MEEEVRARGVRRELTVLSEPAVGEIRRDGALGERQRALRHVRRELAVRRVEEEARRADGWRAHARPGGIARVVVVPHGAVFVEARRRANPRLDRLDLEQHRDREHIPGHLLRGVDHEHLVEHPRRWQRDVVELAAPVRPRAR